MNIFMIKKSLFFFSVIVVLLSVTTSCVSETEILYFQDLQRLQTSGENQQYKTNIQSNDLLSILVSSYDLDAVRPFNLSSVAPDQIGMGQSNTSQQGQSYLVDSDGAIEFPVLGKIMLVGLSRTEAAAILKEKIAVYVKDPIVNLRIINYKVTVLGEVQKPGTFTILDERISVLEAIGLAGDLTIYGKRNTVTVIREGPNGEKLYGKLDLRKIDIFKSEYFYLQQNDVVIVAPNKAKVNQAGVNPSTTLYLSIASLLVGIATLLIRFN